MFFPHIILFTSSDAFPPIAAPLKLFYLSSAFAPLNFQIFMCLLWMLLQFVVLAMYWDVPPVSSEGAEEVMLEMKREREAEEDEGVPLMGSDEEPVNTYSAVSCSRTAEEQPACGSPAEPNVFRNFSISRGELRLRRHTQALQLWIH